MNSKFVRNDGLPQNRKISQEEKRNRNRCKSIDLIVEEIKVQRFEEKKYIQHPNEYQSSGTDPSLLVIFNLKTFEDDVRLGSNTDVNEMVLSFGRLGHNVEQEFIYNDLLKNELLTTIKDLAQRDFSNRNSLILVVLTHGGENNRIHTQDGTIFTHEIWDPFTNTKCSSFKDKPKLFIFQACKGKSFSQIDQMKVDVLPESTFSTPLEADMLIAYAAVEGSVANRHIYRGTWFIQELCRNLNAYGRRDDVLTLLIRTTKCITNNYYHVTDCDELRHTNCRSSKKDNVKRKKHIRRGSTNKLGSHNLYKHSVEVERNRATRRRLTENHAAIHEENQIINLDSNGIDADTVSVFNDFGLNSNHILTSDVNIVVPTISDSAEIFNVTLSRSDTSITLFQLYRDETFNTKKLLVNFIGELMQAV
ncbi:hypothetical protein RN001_015518 [Aquatica leii]|uniref:Uncharacterized protein n=1 Tax=Aquatica leii TaxID=1421715 RepID=A0AAN7NZ99_9COLE|nr:hypothetical protein RN001_015518 [Aquatica leii]